MQDLHDKTGTKFRDLLHSLTLLGWRRFPELKKSYGARFFAPSEVFFWNSADYRGNGFWEGLKEKELWGQTFLTFLEELWSNKVEQREKALRHYF